VCRGKNKCAAIVCRLLCVGFAALLFLRSVGLCCHVGCFGFLEVTNCRHSMTPYGKQYAYVAGFQGTIISKLHKCFFLAQCFNLPQKPAIIAYCMLAVFVSFLKIYVPIPISFIIINFL